MSDIKGKKPQAFRKFAKKYKLGFLTLESSGHGKSSGDFTRGNISIWSNDVKLLIKKFVKKNDFIIVGSSMGAWIGLKMFNNFKSQIKGFLGIGSAPEFLTKLMWNKFSKKIRKEIINDGITYLEAGKYNYPITHQLIKDGRKNKVLRKKIKTNIKVTMVHGQKDEVVPTIFSKKVLSVFSKSEKKLVVIKNGDHSLSNSKNLKKI